MFDIMEVATVIRRSLQACGQGRREPVSKLYYEEYTENNK